MDEMRILADSALFAGIRQRGNFRHAPLPLAPPPLLSARGRPFCAPAIWRWRWRWCWRAACAWSAWTPGASAASSSALARASALPRPMPAWRANRCSSNVVAAHGLQYPLSRRHARVDACAPTPAPIHARLVRNLLTEMAKKNLLLSRKHPPHHAAHHPRTPADLSLRRGGAARHALVRHPLRPPAAGRLSGRGAQRPFRGTLPHAPRWPHRVRAQPLHLC